MALFGNVGGDFELFIEFMQNLLHKLQILILFELILVCVLLSSAYFSLLQFFPLFSSNSLKIKNPKSKFDVLLCQLSLKKGSSLLNKNRLCNPLFKRSVAGFGRVLII